MGVIRLTVGVVSALAVSQFGLASALAGPTSEAEARAQYEAVQENLAVGSGWTGSAEGCVVGSESDASLAATLETLNILRSFAGVAPVRFDPDYNHRALSAALMMTAAKELEHEPKPGWPCYSQTGADAAAASNLYGGVGPITGSEAVFGYVEDDGTEDLGHRRWTLSPAATLFGSGTTDIANALYNPGTADVPIAPGTLVAWPPAGFVPWPWVPKVWSVAIGSHAEGDNVSFSQPDVTVEVDGQRVADTNLRRADPDYGPSETLSWEVDLPPALRTGTHAVHVSISGVRENGAAVPIDYSFSAFAVGEGADGAGCTQAKTKLAKAKRKLKRLKRNGANRKRVAKAKKRVRKARAQVAASC